MGYQMRTCIEDLSVIRRGDYVEIATALTDGGKYHYMAGEFRENTPNYITLRHCTVREIDMTGNMGERSMPDTLNFSLGENDKVFIWTPDKNEEIK